MKTVLVLAGLIALVQSSVVQPPPHSFKTKQADAVIVDRHRKVLSLFKDISVGQSIGQNSGQNVGQNIGQINMFAEYYETGKQYDVKANIDNYNNVNVVNEFLKLYETGFLPKNYEFSVFHDRLRAEAIALFHLLYYAKDFDTFYKTAAYARVHLNERLFLYAYYIAVIHRSDTRELVLPAPYVVNPQHFVNWDTAFKIYRTKMQGGILNPKEAHKHGIIKEGNDYVYYANYSNTLLYNNVEQRLTYFTEDIGLNSYYYYFHTHWPFWWKTGERYESLKDRRGEVYYYFYQQLLARYYFERLTNGLGSIPEFSWYSPVKTGHYPLMTSYYYPFAQRPDNYNVHTEKNYEKVRFLDTYETSFLEFLQEGHFEAFDQKVDFHDPKAINFVGNYWQGNADLYGENFTKIYQRSYDIVARQVLGAAPEPHNDYHFMPSSLDFYQTSLRDPIFYRLYNRIMKYFIEFKQYLEPYTKEKLHFLGVKVTNVEVDKLVTFFDFYQFDASNMTFTTKEDIDTTSKFIVRQPRLNHKDFNFTIDINSDIATDAVFKIFFGPKYDQNGHPINLENNWMNFFEMDVFTHKINPGQNKIVRNSNEFSLFKKDSLPITDLLKLLDEGKVPYLDISEDFVSLPERLMLPRGTYGGFPFQFVVFVYPPKSTTKDLTPFETLIIDNEPLGYPFDRPVEITSFKQPNIFFKDVLVHHEGEYHPYELNVPSIFSRSNEVPK